MYVTIVGMDNEVSIYQVRHGSYRPVGKGSRVRCGAEPGVPRREQLCVLP